MIIIHNKPGGTCIVSLLPFIGLISKATSTGVSALAVAP